MAITLADIAPQDPAAPAPAAAPVAPAPEAEVPSVAVTPEPKGKPVIPDDVLKIPAFSALLQGAPPAVFAPKGSEQAHPGLKVVTDNYQALIDAGFGFYRPKSAEGMVFFNTQFISPEEVKVADDKGRLAELAPDVNELFGFFNENLKGAAPSPEAAPAAPAPTPGPSAPPPPAGAQKAIAGARARAVTPTGPSGGPLPGQGRLLNAILKPVV
jgi:hypothetical protein